MLNMSEESTREIEKIKSEWAKEVSKIKEKESFNGFNQKEVNKEYERLKKKYLPRIQELME